MPVSSMKKWDDFVKNQHNWDDLDFFNIYSSSM